MTELAGVVFESAFGAEPAAAVDAVVGTDIAGVLVMAVIDIGLTSSDIPEPQALDRVRWAPADH